MRRRSKPTTLPIGSISSGTLRMEDLIPALVGALEGLRLTREERKTLADVRRASEHADRVISSEAEGEDCVDYWQNDAADDYDALTQIADAHCPDYCYFGSTAGDGAEIGVWPSWDGLRDAEHDRTLTRVDGALPIPFSRHITHALQVNDHGNATLYRRAGRRWLEVWSIV